LSRLWSFRRILVQNLTPRVINYFSNWFRNVYLFKVHAFELLRRLLNNDRSFFLNGLIQLDILSLISGNFDGCFSLWSCFVDFSPALNFELDYLVFLILLPISSIC
jgi:hypothetical protein